MTNRVRYLQRKYMVDLVTVLVGLLIKKANDALRQVNSNSVFASFFILVAMLIPTTNILAAPGDNVALASAGGVATQSTYYNGGWPASNCINGVTSSNSASELCHTGKNPKPNEWWDLQLPASVPIDSIVIHNRTNCCSSRILGLYILVSDTPFPSGTNAASLAAARAQSSFEFLITQNVTVTNINVGHLLGQYVRIQKSGVGVNTNSAINLLEVEVLEGSPVDLNITKAVSDESPSIGNVVTFTLTVENLGDADAANISVTDALAAGFGNISNISNSGTLNLSGGIDWLIDSLPSGTTATLSFDAEILPP